MPRSFIIELRDKFNKKSMAEQLFTKKGTGKAIAALLGLSERTVSLAIRGHSNSALAKRVRTLAKKCYGAVEVTRN